ncbi:MAG TPA: hypothetical protein VFB99_13935 [Vicinamibacterales bacterium]|nr:hypothetical protein [Vicinamibacterales bacterium]
MPRRGPGDLPGDPERLIDQDRAKRDAMLHNGVARKALAPKAFERHLAVLA